MWEYFRKYHYLSDNLHKGSKCFVGVWNNRLVSFLAMLQFPHPKNKLIKRIHRLVVLPDYQGIGIGSRMCDIVAKHFTDQGYQVRIVSTLKSLLYGFLKNDQWRVVRYDRLTSNTLDSLRKYNSNKRYTFTAIYKRSMAK